MFRRIATAGLLSLLLIVFSHAEEPPRPANAIDPFAKAAAGKVSFQRTAQGLLVLSNVPGNRYTFELIGKQIDRVNYEDKDNPHARMWSVDGIVVQTIPLPMPPGRRWLVDAQNSLSGHQQFENDYWAKGGWKEVESARRWLKFPSGQPALYWELEPTKDAKPGKAKKNLFANTFNGGNVILMSVAVLPGVDEARAKKLLIDTLLTLKRYEKDVVRQLASVYASAMLLNSELASRKDRKAPSAIVVEPETLMLLLRMMMQLEKPRPGGYITLVHDGLKGHCVTLEKYDPAKKRFIYWDPGGKGSFLEKENNRAGVKAEPVPGERKFFMISQADLQTVLQGVIAVPYSLLRPYFAAADLDEAVQEYRLLQKRYPKSEEVSEKFLLKAAQILADGNENARAFNVLAACGALYPKSTRALCGIAEIYAKIGRTQPALNFYADAIKGLADDPSLDDAQRKQLADAWRSARKALEAKANKPKS